MAGPTLLEIDATQQTLEITSSRDAVSIQGRAIETGTPTDGEVMTYSTSSSEWIYQTITENVDDRVAALIQDSAGGGLTWTYDDSAGTLTPAYVGDSTLVTSGALNSGSITSGFGTINIGSSALTAGAASFTTISGSTSLALASGATVTGIDNGSLGSSATLLATQGAIKTYVDAQVTAQDLDLITDSGNIDIDLDSESLTLAGGTGLDSSASSTTVTFAIDSTVATLSGSQTLTNKTIAGGSNTLSAIANGSLTNSTVAYGGVTLSLGGADTTPAFNLSDATAYPGDSSLVTTGTITSGTWQGTTVAVNQGGTGATSLTDGGVLLGSGTGAITATSVLGDGEILIGDASGDPATLDVGSSTAITILGTVATGVWNGTAITGAYIDATSSPLANTKIWIGSASNVAAEFALSGNATMTAGGVVTVSTAAACSGLAATATALATARAINGTDFDGTAAITVTAAAGTLTGTELKSTVVTSSLTSVGTIATGVWNGTAITGAYIDPTSSPLASTKIWIGSGSNVAAEFALSGDATMTAGGAVTVSTAAACTGNAATATALQTARTIGGTSFDGTANIAVALSATTTALATARAINGTDFDGTAAITVTAAAGTLTGATLNSGVTASSLTSVGTLTSLGVSGTGTVGGILSVDDTTESTSTTTGSVHTDGGVGIAKDLIIGGDTIIGATATSGAAQLFVAGGSSKAHTRLHSTVTQGDGTEFGKLSMQGSGREVSIRSFYDHASSAYSGMSIYTDGAAGTVKALTIDSSQDTTLAGALSVTGNVMVGNTVTNPASGFAAQKGLGFVAATGNLEASANNSVPLELGRYGGFGSLMAFRYAGTSIGTISTADGTRLDLALTGALSVARTGSASNWATTITNNYDGDSDVSVEIAFANSSGRNSGIGVSMDDANSGEYCLSLASGGSPRFIVKGDGLVGIGTASPSSELDLRGSTGVTITQYRDDSSISAGNRLGYLAWGGDGGDDTQDAAVLRVEADGTWASGDTPSRFVFRTTPDGSGTVTDALTIDSSQNTTLAGALSVAGAATVGGNLVVSGTGPHSIGAAADGAYRLRLAGSYTSDGTDSVAIGTFHGGIVTGASGDDDYMAGMFLDTQLITQTATADIDVISQLRVAEPNIQDNLTGDIGIAASVYIHATPTEGEENAALWVQDGKVVVGGHIVCGPNALTNAGYNNASYPLTVAYSGASHQGAGFYDNTTDGSARYAIYFNRYPSSSWTTVGSISTTDGATAFNTSSDYRLKENEQPFGDALDLLGQLKPYKFNFKIHDASQITHGFFAHEAAEIVPQAVIGEKDAVDDDGKIISQSIDHSHMVPLMVAAIQELTAKVEVLESA